MQAIQTIYRAIYQSIQYKGKRIIVSIAIDLWAVLRFKSIGKNFLHLNNRALIPKKRYYPETLSKEVKKARALRRQNFFILGFRYIEKFHRY